MGHQVGVGKKSCIRATPYWFLLIYRDTNTKNKQTRHYVSIGLRIQQTIPSQYIYVAELDAALNDPLFLLMYIAIFQTFKIKEKYLSTLIICKKVDFIRIV